jgi:hypothetical protein
MQPVAPPAGAAGGASWMRRRSSGRFTSRLPDDPHSDPTLLRAAADRDSGHRRGERLGGGTPSVGNYQDAMLLLRCAFSLGY